MVNASVQTNYNLLTPVYLSPVSHLSGGSDKGPGDTNIFNLFQWNGRNSSLHKACLLDLTHEFAPLTILGVLTSESERVESGSY